MALTRGQLTGWLDAYFDAWRSNDGSEVAKLFSEDAVYSYGPFREPARGRDQIVANWIADGPPLTAESRYEILATDDVNAAGECVEHLEWFDRRTIDEPPMSSATGPGQST